MLGLIVVRTKVLDRYIEEAVTGQGIEQVVVFGSGLDARVFRMPVLEKISTFEVGISSPKSYVYHRVVRTPPTRHTYTRTRTHTGTYTHSYGRTHTPRTGNKVYNTLKDIVNTHNIRRLTPSKCETNQLIITRP